MNPTLITFGMLMIASAVTLLSAHPRTWLVAIAQGIGIQGFIAAGVSAVQVGWFYESADKLSMAERATMAVQGIPFNCAGWSARSIYEAVTNDAHPGAMHDLNSFVTIAAIQIGVISLVLAWRKMQEERLCDLVTVFVMLLLLVNSACNIYWPWWAA
jgi:hypothetical protein